VLPRSHWQTGLKVSSAGARAVSRMSTSSSSMLKQLLLAASAMVNRTSGSDAQNFPWPADAVSRPGLQSHSRSFTYPCGTCSSRRRHVFWFLR